jgi:hypothetical protein
MMGFDHRKTQTGKVGYRHTGKTKWTVSMRCTVISTLLLLVALTFYIHNQGNSYNHVANDFLRGGSKTSRIQGVQLSVKEDQKSTTSKEEISEDHTIKEKTSKILKSDHKEIYSLDRRQNSVKGMLKSSIMTKAFETTEKTRIDDTVLLSTTKELSPKLVSEETVQEPLLTEVKQEVKITSEAGPETLITTPEVKQEINITSEAAPKTFISAPETLITTPEVKITSEAAELEAKIDPVSALNAVELGQHTQKLPTTSGETALLSAGLIDTSTTAALIDSLSPKSVEPEPEPALPSET